MVRGLLCLLLDFFWSLMKATYLLSAMLKSIAPPKRASVIAMESFEAARISSDEQCHVLRIARLLRKLSIWQTAATLPWRASQWHTAVATAAFSQIDCNSGHQRHLCRPEASRRICSSLRDPRCKSQPAYPALSMLQNVDAAAQLEADNILLSLLRLLQRTFRKFTFRGVDLDQLLDMNSDELIELFHARARRR